MIKFEFYHFVILVRCKMQILQRDKIELRLSKI